MDLRALRAVVTGGAGFLGSHLCESLIDAGASVLCVDNLSTGSLDNLGPLLDHDRFELRRHDATTYLDVEGAVDAVFHFASPASPIDYLQLPIQTLKVGALGTHNALGLALAKQARFMLASTSEVYGDPLVHPQPETYWGNVNPIGPRGVYDEAKRFAEAITFAYHRSHGLDIRVPRIFNTYGPRMRLGDGRAVPTFIARAMADQKLTVHGDGSQTRSLCFVDDLIAGFLALWASDVVEPVNLGSEREISMTELAETVMDAVGRHPGIEYVERPVDDPQVRRPDITRARDQLAWAPQVSLDEGLRRTIAWYRQGGVATASDGRG
jgi:dTDP-glucose 4,6-dehydratase